MNLPETDPPEKSSTLEGNHFLAHIDDEKPRNERRFCSRTYSEKKKLCKSILKKWGNVDVNNITPTMVLKHLCVFRSKSATDSD